MPTSRGGDDAALEAEGAEEAEGLPAHAEVSGDAGVAQIEDAAQRTWDVFHAWAGVWTGGTTHDLDDPQRRLRWALDGLLPERVRAALPLVEVFARSGWDEFFADTDITVAERDVREELRSVRTRVAQGLPVVGRWMVTTDFGPVDAGDRDATAYLWGIERREETRRITVHISGSALGSADESLPQEVAAAKRTNGRSVLTTLVANG